MINKLIIDGFKGLEHAEYELGQDTIITGANGEGKSRIIEAIIYCLTGEVNGYKKKLKNCSVSIQGNGLNMSRVNGKVIGREEVIDIKQYLCSIVPGYINSLTIKEKIKMLVGIDDVNAVPFETGTICTYEVYKEAMARVKKFSKVLDGYGDDIIKNLQTINELGDTNIGSLIEIKKRFDELENHQKLVQENCVNEELKEKQNKRIEKLKEKLEGFDSSIDLGFVKQQLTDKVKHYDNLLEAEMINKNRIETMEHGKCYVCNQETIDTTALDLLKQEAKTIKKEKEGFGITKIREELKKVDSNLETYELNLAYHRELQQLLANEIKEIDIPEVNYTDEEFEDLKLKLDNFEELFAKQKKKELLLAQNKELGERIANINIANDNADIQLFQEGEQKYFKKKAEEYKFSFNLTLYKNNESTDGGQLVYEIEQNGIDYFWLSSAQKLLIDTEISLKIAERYLVDFMLIDNGERLTNENQKKILEMLGAKQIILTRVSQGKLKLEID